MDKSVTLTDEERERIKAALNADWDASECDTVYNLAEAVETILAAREQALHDEIAKLRLELGEWVARYESLREEIAGEIEVRETFGKGSKDYAFGFAVARRTFARIARGGAR